MACRWPVKQSRRTLEESSRVLSSKREVASALRQQPLAELAEVGADAQVARELQPRQPAAVVHDRARALRHRQRQAAARRARRAIPRPLRLRRDRGKGIWSGGETAAVGRPLHKLRASNLSTSTWPLLLLQCLRPSRHVLHIECPTRHNRRPNSWSDQLLFGVQQRCRM